MGSQHDVLLTIYIYTVHYDTLSSEIYRLILSHSTILVINNNIRFNFIDRRGRCQWGTDTVLTPAITVLEKRGDFPNGNFLLPFPSRTIFYARRDLQTMRTLNNRTTVEN